MHWNTLKKPFADFWTYGEKPRCLSMLEKELACLLYKFSPLCLGHGYIKVSWSHVKFKWLHSTRLLGVLFLFFKFWRDWFQFRGTLSSEVSTAACLASIVNWYWFEWFPLKSVGLLLYIYDTIGGKTYTSCYYLQMMLHNFHMSV